MNIHGRTAVPPEELETFRRLCNEYKHEDGKPNIAEIARIMGRPRNTLKAWPAKLEAHDKEQRIEMPAFLDHDEDEPIAEIIARKRKGFERKAKAHADRQWFEIKVRETQPYGLIAFGDPHLDDDGCNIPLLEHHLSIAAQPGIYSLNIGDTHNNWVGRLERLYAHQEASKNTGKRLVEWFMWDSGATWLCWLVGNHDDWNDGADFLLRLARKKISVIDWRAQFRIIHPSGTDVRIDASHGRKGSSIWNNLHATLRAAKLGELADLYLTGHTHNFGLEDLEIPDRRHSCWLVQLRGYKFMDHYALVNNFAEHQRGSAVFTVIDPRPDARTKVQCFEDVDMGADYLRFLRSRA